MNRLSCLIAALAVLTTAAHASEYFGAFTLRSESPALALGFQPIDFSQVGLRIKIDPNP